MSQDFSPDQKRYLEGFVSGLNAARASRGVLPGGSAKGEPAGPDAIHIKAQDKTTADGGKLTDQEKFKREEHPFDAYDRLKEQADKNEAPKPADNFRWRYFGLFYVAPAQASYMCRLRIPNGILKHWQLCGACRPHRALRRALFACHHAREFADPRDRAEERRRGRARHREPRPVVARLGRGQHPQRDRHADRRHRPPGTARHAPLCARVALPHPQRPLALRPAAQVQRRVRRRAASSPTLGRDQRHRLPGRRGNRRPRHRAGHLVPPRARRHHRPQGFRARHRRAGEARRTRPRSPTPSCACSSRTATAPTATRRG